MLKIKKLVAKILIVSIIMTSNAIVTFAEQVGETVFYEKESSRNNYYLDMLIESMNDIEDTDILYEEDNQEIENDEVEQETEEYNEEETGQEQDTEEQEEENTEEERDVSLSSDESESNTREIDEETSIYHEIESETSAESEIESETTKRDIVVCSYCHSENIENKNEFLDIYNCLDCNKYFQTMFGKNKVSIVSQVNDIFLKSSNNEETIHEEEIIEENTTETDLIVDEETLASSEENEETITLPETTESSKETTIIITEKDIETEIAITESESFTGIETEIVASESETNEEEIETEATTEAITIEESTIETTETISSESDIDELIIDAEATYSEVTVDESLVAINVDDVATDSEIVYEDTEISTESDVDIATTNEISSNSITLRHLEGQTWDDYNSYDKFYNNSNEWNKLQKQLFEFHKIREAWDYIYNNKIVGSKVGVMVYENNFYNTCGINNVETDNQGNDYYYVGPSTRVAQRRNNNEGNPISHGTSVASIIAGKFNPVGKALPQINGKVNTPSNVVSGVASGINNEFAQVYQAYTSYSYNYNEISQYVNYFNNHNANTRVVNLSIDWLTSLGKKNFFNKDLLDDRIVTVVSAGNEGYILDHTICDELSIEEKKRVADYFDRTITVGALQTSELIDCLDFDSEKIAYSDTFFKECTNRGSLVDLYACANNLTCMSQMEQRRFGGTSSAAPVVSGIVALMLYVNPDLNVRQVKSILKNATTKIILNNNNSTFDIIKCPNAYYAVWMADNLYRDNHSIDYAILNNKAFINTEKYIMMDRRWDDKENAIVIEKPTLRDSRIKDDSGYEWRITSIDGKKYDPKNNSFHKYYLIEDGRVFIIKTDDMYEKESAKNDKHIVKVGYFNIKTNEELDLEGSIPDEGEKGVDIFIYPNEVVNKKELREDKYGLGANSLVNPSKIVPAFELTKKKHYFANENDGLIVDKHDIIVVYDDHNNRYVSNLITNKKDSIVILPYTASHFLSLAGIHDEGFEGVSKLNNQIKNMRIKGIKKLTTSDLSYDDINNGIGLSEYRRLSKESINAWAYKDIDSYFYYPYLIVSGKYYNEKIANWAGNNLDIINKNKFKFTLNDDGKLKTSIIPLKEGAVADNKCYKVYYNDEVITCGTVPFNFFIGKYENSVFSQKIEIPKANILMTKNDNKKELIFIPDENDSNRVDIKANKIYITKYENKNTKKTEYRLEDEFYNPLKIQYNVGMHQPNEVFINLLSLDNIVDYKSNTGYTDDKTRIKDKNSVASFGVIDEDIFSKISQDNLGKLYETVSINEMSTLFGDEYYSYLYLEHNYDTSDFESHSLSTLLVPIEIREMIVEKQKPIDKPIFIVDGNNGKEVNKEEIKKSDDDPNKPKVVKIELYPKNGEGDVDLISLKDLFSSQDINEETENGHLIGAIVSFGGETQFLSLNDYIDLNSSYYIVAVRVKKKEPRLWHPSWFDKLSMSLISKLLGYCSDRIKIDGKLYVKVSDDTYEEVMVDGNSIEDIQSGYIKLAKGNRRLSVDTEGLDNEFKYKLTLGTMSDTDVEELRDLFEEEGIDIDKMSEGKDSFEDALRSFIDTMFDDYEVSLDDFAPYIKVDLREFIPTASEIIDKNFVRFVNSKGEEVTECYLDEEIEVETSDAISIVKDKGYKVSIDSRDGGYIYKYKIPQTGKYSIVSYNNGEIDPYVEVYTIKDGEIVEDKYTSDNDSLFNKNAIISSSFTKGEEIYIRCSTADGEIGSYDIAIIDYTEELPTQYDLDKLESSETEFGNIGISTESDVDIATTNEISSNSNTLRHLEGEDWIKYKGEENFYTHSNEWNKYQKQLFEFHKIREAWEYIYNNRSEDNKQNRVNVMILDDSFYKIHDNNNIGTLNINNNNDKHYYYFSTTSQVVSKRIEDFPIESKIITSIPQNMKEIIPHGAMVTSIISDEFHSNKTATASKISGVASGYNNDLVSVIPVLLNTGGYQFYNLFGMPLVAKKKNVPIKVINCSFDWSPYLKHVASTYEQIYNKEGDPINVKCGDVEVELSGSKSERRKDLPLLVYAAGNNAQCVNYNCFDNFDKDSKKEISQFFDNDVMLVGGLQSSKDTNNEYDSSSREYEDCEFYFDSTNVGGLVDIYACQNNVTEYYNERKRGTSFAAPIVSGVAALMYYMNHNLTAAQAKNILYKTADKKVEKYTNDKIRVLNAEAAVREAHIMQEDNYNPDENRVYFKTTKFVMNDRGNNPKAIVKEDDYKENCMMLPRPYFDDCRIDDFSKYGWKINTVDGNNYDELNNKFYKVEDNVFIIDKNIKYDANEELNKHVIKLQYVNNINNKVMYDLDENNNKVEEIEIVIYPNEHIAKQVFRTKEYSLGANALINPYKVVSSFGYNDEADKDAFSVKKDSFAKSEFNYDKIKIGYRDGLKENILDKIEKDLRAPFLGVPLLTKVEWGGTIDELQQVYNKALEYYISSVSNVLRVDDKAIYILPHSTIYKRKQTYSTYMNPHFLYPLMKVGISLYGINHLIKEPLTEEYIGGDKSGFSDVYLKDSGVYKDAKGVTSTDNKAYEQYPFLYYEGRRSSYDDYFYYSNGLNTGTYMQSYEFGKNGLYKRLAVTGQDLEDNILSIPFSNILYTKNHYKEEDLNSNFKEIVVIPDNDNVEKIIATDSFTVRRIKKTNNTYEYKIDRFDLIKYEPSTIEAARNLGTLKYMMFPQNANINFDPEKGYTTNGRNNVISDIKVLKINGNETNEIRKTYETADFNDADAETLYNDAKTHEVRIFLERGAQNSFNKTATKLIRVNIIEEEDKPKEENPKTYIVDVAADKSKDKTINNKEVKNKEEKEVTENEENVHCTCACIVFDKNGIGIINKQKIEVVSLYNLLDEAGVLLSDDDGVVVGAMAVCEHKSVKYLDLDSYINLDNSYVIKLQRVKNNNPQGYIGDEPSDNRKGIRKILYKIFLKITGTDEEWSNQVKNMTFSEYAEYLKNNYSIKDKLVQELQDVLKILPWVAPMPGKGFRVLEDTDPIESIENVSIGTLSEAELIEIRDTLEDLGFDVEKMSADETDFKVVLEKFIQDMLSDNVISFDDYAKYLKVDLTEYIPTASEIVDKNFVSFVDKKGKAINECYLDELVEKVDIELKEPENIVKDKVYAVNIDKKTTGYLYKYKASSAGNYSVVSFNNGEVDPYLELYTIKNEEIVESTYVSDNDSLYNKNGIISKKLNRGEEIYIRCSTADGEIGSYDISIINDNGKKPIIGDGYEELSLTSGEYYLYNDIKNIKNIKIESSDVKVDLNGKSIDVEKEGYIINALSSKIQLGNGTIINRGSSKQIISLENDSVLEVLSGYYSGEIEDKGNVALSKETATKSLIIKGGYFTSDRVKDYVGERLISRAEEHIYNGNVYKYRMVPYRALTVNDFGKNLIDGDYYLDKDITCGNSPIFIKGNVNIDLRGNTLRGTKTWYSTIEVRSGVLNIKNGTIISDYGYDIYVYKGATANIESGNYYSSGGYDSVWGGDDGSGRIMINGGTFSKMPSKYEVKEGYDIIESQTVIKSFVLNYKLVKAEYIKDIKIGGEDESFSGYTKMDVDLNKETKGDSIYLWYNITNNKDEAIKDLKLTFNESGATTQDLSGYTKIDYDLNKNTGGDYIYLWYTRSGNKPVMRIEVENFSEANEDKDNWDTVKGNRNYNHTYTKTEYINETRTRTVAKTKYKTAAVTKYRTEARTVWQTVKKVVWKQVKSFFGFFKALFTWKWKSYIEYVTEPVTTYVQVPYTVYEQQPYTVYEEETYVALVPVIKTYTETRTDYAYYGDLNKNAHGEYIYLRYQ